MCVKNFFYISDAKELSDNKVKQLQEELDRLLSELNAV
uniref:VPS28 C-terminal domain-containing protein n=1 Tax=Ascaris lumbricoides TaxID=6252 RepID=A0A0M3IPV2_ASCLU